MTEDFTDKMPKWFSRWVKKKYLRGGLPCGDHIKFTKDGCVILEPYDQDMSCIKKLIELCEKENWTFTISGHSYHYPNHTFRIEIRNLES